MELAYGILECQQDSWFDKENILINLGNDHELKPVYLIVGRRIDKYERRTQVTIDQLNNLVTTNQAFRTYTLIYLNNHKNGNELDGARYLKIINKSIPELQLKRLSKLIIICPGLALKTLITCTLNSLNHLKQKITYIDSFNELPGLVKLDTNTLQLVKAIDDNQSQPPIHLIKKFYGKPLSEYQKDQEGIPIFLKEFVRYFKGRNDYLAKEGCFRIPGSTIEEEKLVRELAQEDFVTLHNYQPDVVGTVYKRVWDQMKEPLFPQSVFDLLKETPPNASEEELGQTWMSCLSQIDNISRSILFYNLEFFTYVAQFKDSNKMTTMNMAIVFAPCFLRAQSIADSFKIKILIGHFSFLIEHQWFYAQMQIKNPMFSLQSDLQSSENQQNQEQVQLKMVESVLVHSSPKFKGRQVDFPQDSQEIKKKWYQKMFHW